jgi:hypothetical protein
MNESLATSLKRVCIRGSHAYVAEASYPTLVILSLANPLAPVKTGETNIGSAAYAVEVREPYAFLATGIALYLVDVSSPASPDLIGPISPTAYSRDVCVEGDLVYMADSVSETVYISSLTDVPGDVSGDAVANAPDLAIVLQSLAGHVGEGLHPCLHPWQADFDEDGSLSATDAVTLAHRLAGNL